MYVCVSPASHFAHASRAELGQNVWVNFEKPISLPGKEPQGA